MTAPDVPLKNLRRLSERVRPPLSSDDAKDSVNRKRRNAFYWKFGIRFACKNVDAVQDAVGESLPLKSGSLIDLDSHALPNIQEQDVAHVLAAATHLLPLSQRRVIDLNSYNAELRRDLDKSILASARLLNELGFIVAFAIGVIVGKFELI